jgi:hypothetical protein
MRVLWIVLMVALLAWPAHAQHARGRHSGGSQPGQSAEQKKRALENEKEFGAALKRIPDPPNKPKDPWGNVR